MNGQFIVCYQCSYFPNKADQISFNAIRIHIDGTQWICPVCCTPNVFPSSSIIALPETAITAFSSLRLLRTQSRGREECSDIQIRLGSEMTNETLYYCAQNRQEIQDCWGIDLSQVKNMGQLRQESSWMQTYWQLKKAYYKTLSGCNGGSEVVTAESYLIYLLHQLAATLQSGTLKITVRRGRESFCFHIGIGAERAQELADFLKVYILLNLQSHHWLIKLNSQLIRKYQTSESRGQQGRKLMLFSLDSTEQSPHLAHYQMVVQLRGTAGSNIFNISPTATNPVFPRIRKHATNNKTVLFYRRLAHNTIHKRNLNGQMGGLVRGILGARQTVGEKERQLCQLLEPVLEDQHRVELHRLCCQSRQTVSLVSFNWQKIESELLLEELVEGRAHHCLQEDILTHQFTKLHHPSPFLKKAPRQQLNNHQDEEEYL